MYLSRSGQSLDVFRGTPDAATLVRLHILLDRPYAASYFLDSTKQPPFLLSSYSAEILTIVTDQTK